jgi:hypothetical protein
MWTDALEIVVSRTGAERLRYLCSEENPDVPGRARYRKQVTEMAAQPAVAPRPISAPSYPPLAEQVTNALKAGLSFAASGFKLTSQAEHDRRLSICQAPCEFWDKELGRCVKCGCVDTIKAWIESQKCPMDYWKKKP